MGRPFLATSQGLIDVSDGKLEPRMGNEKVTFRLPNAMKHSLYYDDLYYCADVVDDVVDEHVLELTQVNSLQSILGEVYVEEQGPPRGRGGSWNA